jgi:hypothetical protein
MGGPPLHSQQRDGCVPDPASHIFYILTVRFVGGDAYVYVNDEKMNVRDLNVRAGLHHVVPISVVLQKSNNITFAVHTSDPQFEAHLDGIEVLDGTEEEIEVKL